MVIYELKNYSPKVITQGTLNYKEVQILSIYWLALMNNWTDSVNRIQNALFIEYSKKNQETSFWSIREKD